MDQPTEVRDSADPHEDTESLGGRTWQVMATVRKYRANHLPTDAPLETITRAHNMLLDEGAGELLDLVFGLGSPVAYSAALARIGVGDGTAVVVATQVGLQGATQAYKAMDAGYPSRAGRVVELRATFGVAEGNFAWNEWTVDNGAARSRNLSRKLAAFGTKSGQDWELTISYTVAP